MVKQTFIYFLFILGVFSLYAPSLTAQSAVLDSFEFVQTYTKADVQDILDDYGVPDFLIKPEHDVDFYRVWYRTPDATGTDTTWASGALVVPKGITCDLPQLSYQHGTTSQRYGVPSYASQELNIGIIFASAGSFVTSLPDYLGMGDGPGFHPYVHAKSEATASIDLLRATRELQDSIGFELNGQVFLFGYSQGGHATMATAKEIEENYMGEFDLTASAPMSGPYDVSGVQATTMTDSVAYATPGYLPYVVLGFAEVYGAPFDDVDSIFRPPYDTLIPTLFDGFTGIGTINSMLPDTPNHMLDSIVFTDFLNNPDTNPMRIALRDNDLYRWAPTTPIRMMYCTEDEQVFYENAIVAYDSMTARGSTSIEAVNMGAYDHGGCVQYCLLNVKEYFEQYRDVTGGMQFTPVVTDATHIDSLNGSITLTITGGEAPYTYDWFTGDSTETITGLGEGTYAIRVSDSNGCYQYLSFQVGVVSSVQKLYAEAREYFTIAPNPASSFVRFEIADAMAEGSLLSVYNSLGHVIAQVPVNYQNVVEMDLADFSAGLYMVELRNGNQSFTQKLIIQQ